MLNITKTLDFIADRTERNIAALNGKCQNHSSVNGIYPPCANDQWTCGFFPGIVWLMYEHTGDEAFKWAGLRYVQSFHDRIVNKIAVDHHDMGFLYTPSCVAAYMLTGSEAAREAARLAAKQLAGRFREPGDFLQAWGALDDPNNYRYIIDCLMNLPLLYGAGLGDIADKHMETCLKHSFRADGSAHHTVFMSPETGAFLRGETCQGFTDNSFWARAQAWAIYGASLNGKPEAAGRALAFYNSKLPTDGVPYWDMVFNKGELEPRDSSSACIVAAALADKGDREGAAKTLEALYGGGYVSQDDKSNGLVLHGTYAKKSPYNTCTEEGVDECCSWGDYFFAEALLTLAKPGRESYWRAIF